MLFLITFGCFALVIGLLALGTMLGRGPLARGCGAACQCVEPESPPPGESA